MPRKEDAEVRFWRKVDKRGDAECWPWLGSQTNAGYGQIIVDGRKVLVHRYSYELHKGPIPAGALVCHTCDVRNCTNPAHLWTGSHSDNLNDCVGKQRRPLGVTHSNAKLTPELVRALRALHRAGGTVAELSDLYGVSMTTVRSAVRGITWKHV